MNQKITREKKPGGPNIAKFTSHNKHPKSGPRKVRPGDQKKFEDGWDRIFGNKEKEPEEPLCPLCKGKAEAGTCPCCN